jgi:hypothetical protein
MTALLAWSWWPGKPVEVGSRRRSETARRGALGFRPWIQAEVVDEVAEAYDVIRQSEAFAATWRDDAPPTCRGFVAARGAADVHLKYAYRTSGSSVVTSDEGSIEIGSDAGVYAARGDDRGCRTPEALPSSAPGEGWTRGWSGKRGSRGGAGRERNAFCRCGGRWDRSRKRLAHLAQEVLREGAGVRVSVGLRVLLDLGRLSSEGGSSVHDLFFSLSVLALGTRQEEGDPGGAREEGEHPEFAKKSTLHLLGRRVHDASGRR